MDILHREFTEEALGRISLDLKKFFKLFPSFEIPNPEGSGKP